MSSSAHIARSMFRSSCITSRAAIRAEVQDNFSFSSPMTPGESEGDRPLLTEGTESSSSDGGESAETSPDSSSDLESSPLLAGSLSLADWLRVPPQITGSYARTGLRWAVRTKEWAPSMKEWAFMLTLLPQYEQDQVKRLWLLISTSVIEFGKIVSLSSIQNLMQKQFWVSSCHAVS